MRIQLLLNGSTNRLLVGLVVLGLSAGVAPSPTPSQGLSSLDRDRGRTMLDIVKSDLKKYYYDPAYRGMNVDERFKDADQKIKQATSLGQVVGIIAQVLLDLNDSHAYFIPPMQTTSADYGWQMQMIGDKCFVVAVKPGSDAEVKGLKAGDEVWSLDGIEPTRENIWKLTYLYYALRPRAGMRLVLQDLDGRQREMEVMAKLRQRVANINVMRDYNDLVRESEDAYRLNRHRYIELGDDLFIWKMPQFDLDEAGVDEMMSKAKKHKALILDLRGNGGGAVVTLQRLAGHFFDRDVKIADLKGRKEMKPMVAKTPGGDRVFAGKLAVLVDSRSGSAAELFARVIQIEKRGTVIGDRTPGAVMQARLCDHESGAGSLIYFAASITDADLIMTDGRSLERVGVSPNELLLPTAADLKARRDPVMSRAGELFGVKIEPLRAGAMFPIEWKK
ncbi:MAG TPA: S41 family peptidase [Blastocatellia bacterium]|nr:S41 family peptidase [Blastocatellia bacterium]